jgi:hypothetical protein
VGEDPAGARFYEAAARLYERIAADYDGAKAECAMLDGFVAKAEAAKKG